MGFEPFDRPVRVGCEDCPIRYKAVCALCEADELEQLDRIKSYRTFAAGETIAWAGERMSLVGSVVNGVATLSKTLPDGRRQMVGLLLPSDFIGRPGRPYSKFDVTAATEITICSFRRSTFDRLLRQNPRIGRRLLEMTLDELDAAREWMLLLGRKNAREKIASLFVMMGRRDANLRPDAIVGARRFPLYITRESMADYLGLTIETVSRQISTLRREGYVELFDNRMVYVPDFAKLVVQAGDEADSGLVA